MISLNAGFNNEPDDDEDNVIDDNGAAEGPTVLAHVELARTTHMLMIFVRPNAF